MSFSVDEAFGRQCQQVPRASDSDSALLRMFDSVENHYFCYSNQQINCRGRVRDPMAIFREEALAWVKRSTNGPHGARVSGEFLLQVLREWLDDWVGELWCEMDVDRVNRMVLTELDPFCKGHLQSCGKQTGCSRGSQWVCVISICLSLTRYCENQGKFLT